MRAGPADTGLATPLVLSLLCALALACNGKIDTTSTLDGDGGAASSADSTSCTLSGDECVGAVTCCPPRTGYLLDLARNCKAATKTPLSCDRPRANPTSACGLARNDTSCLLRSSSAGTEIYFTKVSFGPPEGFTTYDCEDSYPDCPEK